MGQEQSGVAKRQLTKEQVTRELASRFETKCFTPLELYHFRDIFKNLADHQDHESYLRHDTVARFLEIPDILGASAVLFQMLDYLGAFPFCADAPAILGIHQMIMVVVIMTERYKTVMKQGSKNRTKLFFRSLAVYDRQQLKEKDETKRKSVTEQQATRSHAAGFDVDEAKDDDEDDPDDDLALVAIESLDDIAVLQHGDAPISQGEIPTDNLKRLIMLLLLLAPVGSQESLARNTDRLQGDLLEGLRKSADNVLAAFVNVEKRPGVKIHQFSTVIPISLPFLFHGFNPLFEHFLFSNNLDFNKRKGFAIPAPAPAPDPLADQPLLADTGEIMDLNILSQLSFFLPGKSLFRKLRLLYSGGDAGFSMGSFESKVFKWTAPTILLVSGTRISDPPSGGQERGYSDSLAPKRFPDSSTSSHVTFGLYLSKPWKQTHKECIGDVETKLFQLEPVHEVFHASTINKDYVSFTKPPNPCPGIAFGTAPPPPRSTHLSPFVNLGAVSLVLDSSFEFAVFTHNYTSGGGAFRTSSSRKYDFQDRFSIESLEVWGCGGMKEADAQKERWAWEEREAERRRRVNMGTGDIEADRALLEMAGLVGQNRSGGSMG